jgi:hypothetical protein
MFGEAIMTSEIDIRELERRPRRYWNIDGIPELVLGVVWVLWGVALLVGEALPRGAAWRVYWMVMPAVLVLGGMAANQITKALKRRVTYPRTGYVELPAPTAAVRGGAAAIAVGAAAVVAGLILKGRTTGAEHTAPVAIGLLFSLAFLIASVRERAPHLLALAGVALMLGIAVATLGLGWSGLNWLLVAMGVASTAVGGWRLRRYVRAHPLESAR